MLRDECKVTSPCDDACESVAGTLKLEDRRCQFSLDRVGSVRAEQLLVTYTKSPELVVAMVVSGWWW